ncbi:Delta(8)-fatty-acid desaturase 2 [Striga hermonthica]|uniref:Delta(8)-fatty-acid desaturase 2 n=1 Tax=Striga hermonthica TaxID=68872 RepID=A0A9N7RS98_STRHE|nr:Delta(8)-fatty-acid desaturase 2 [Striga hermonthica]
MADDGRKYITSEELRRHNVPGDLWISIQGKIYDVTDWSAVHPGGDAPLLNLAGQDVTDAFVAFHPGDAWKHLDPLFTGYRLRDFAVSEVSRDYRSLASHLAKSGMFEKKGHGVIYSLCSVFLMLAACFYGVIFTGSFAVHSLSGCLLGLAWMQVAYLGHDSGHYQIMTTRGFNRFVQILAGNCLTGISIAWWKWTHNAHHIACNSLDYDPDLQHLPMLAVSSKLFNSLTSRFYGRQLTFDSLSRFFVSYQHLTFYPVMCVARVNLYLQTFLLLFSKKRKVPDRAVNLLGILVFWTWFPILVSFLPDWTERFIFVMASFCVTSIQHVQFCLNHFAANVYVGPPRGNDWFEKQTGGTIDISCSSYMDWFFGGLQFQLEHHLFPRLPRCQLRRVSPLVQELCKKHGLPYRSLSFFEANVWTLRTLRNAAREARDMASPVPKNLLWEAINTHG